MTKYLLSSAVAVCLLSAAVPASAGPSSLAVNADAARHNLVQTIRSDCSWLNGGWFYRNGARFVTCRPDRPGRDYTWHHEGKQFGWYNAGRKEWHNRNW